MIPLYFRAYHEDNSMMWKDDQPHGILKIVSRCKFWFRTPGSDEFYQFNIGAKSWAEKQNLIAFHPNDHVKFVKISKAEYDTDIAFDLFPEYKIKYRPLWVRFDDQWLIILLTIFFIHLAIILIAIPMTATGNVSNAESDRQALIAIGSWLIFSSGALCCWLIDSFAYWRRIRRGLTTPASRA